MAHANDSGDDGGVVVDCDNDGVLTSAVLLVTTYIETHYPKTHVL
jgi:hypothetical protein